MSPTRKTLDIDTTQQEIYDYVESLEQKSQHKANLSSQNQENVFNETPMIKLTREKEHRIEDALKQDIYELEVLNKHLTQEREAVKIQNEILKTQNDNILFASMPLVQAKQEAQSKQQIPQKQNQETVE